MKNLVIRTISGAALVAIMVFSIYMSSYWFGGLFLLVNILSLWEFYHLTEKMEGVSVDKWMAIVGGALLFVIAYMVSFLGGRPSLFGVYFVCMASTLAFELFRKKNNPIQNLSATFFGHLYVAVPFSMFCFIEAATEHSKYLLLAFFVIIWASDTGAYLVGRFLGKHKMFERISPKKTWEGFCGGLLFAVASGYIFYRVELVPSLHLEFWLALAILVFIFGVLGDLVESMFKRSLQVKDSGKMIPGHGGFLDRFDSALLSAPILYLLFSLVV